ALRAYRQRTPSGKPRSFEGSVGFRWIPCGDFGGRGRCRRCVMCAPHCTLRRCSARARHQRGMWARPSSGYFTVIGANTRMRSVLVTGASTGIGEACVERLVAAGWRVFASVRKATDAERLADTHGGRVSVVRFDVTDEAAVRTECARVVESCGEQGLDGVVNNAGMAVAGPLEFLPLSELRRQLEVNVIGQVGVVQALLPALRRARGRIVLIGSISGRAGMPFTGAYGASKHALEAIADAWRVELAPWGVRVLIIEPGVITTPIWDTAAAHADGMLAQLPPIAEEYYGKPLGRL